MINGAHLIIHTRDPESDRAFFRDILKFPSVDAGQSWLIFALPPAEAAFHPGEKNDAHELYFMCDDLKATMKELAGKGSANRSACTNGWPKLAARANMGREKSRPMARSGALGDSSFK